MSFRTQSETDVWDNISTLPFEVKQIIGSYSSAVTREKMEIKKEFFLNWTTSNVDRVLDLVSRTWTKHQIIWVLMKCSNVYYWCCSLLLTTKFVLLSFLRREILENSDFDFEDIRKRWQNLKAIEIVNLSLVTRRSAFS
jgi:hypothetical protein